jgi:DNA replication protein DnaC
MCRCLKAYCAREQQKELSRMLDLGSQSFETFSLEWYDQAEDPALGVSPRENMDWIYRTCKRYAAAFGPRSGNLLLTGDPGLGKTFLSAAIAREVSAEGFSVVYDTAAHIFDRFEARKFGREPGEAVEADVDRVTDCDLLILDDLGTELTTPFVQSALYGIVALYVSTLVMDWVLYGMDNAKVAYIISDKPEVIARVIMDDLDRTVTYLQGEGGYLGQPKRVILCAFKQREIVTIKETVRQADPAAFMIVTPAHEVLGEGFGSYHQDV